MASTSTTQDRAREQGRVRWELLAGLVRKDLKVKYQGSVLGFLWSLANPLVVLVVYTFVFQVVLKTGIPLFGFYLLSGLLVWNSFAGAVSTATGAVVGNAGLVKKVRFPLAVLPLSAVGFALIHFALQLVVLLAAMTVSGHADFAGPQILLAVPAIAVAVLFTVALSFLVAGLNVRYRDTQHVVEVALLAGFWLNPIVYSVSLVRTALEPHGLFWAYFLNPMAGVVTAMQRAFYARNPALPGGGTVLADSGYSFYLEKLGLGALVSAALLVLGLWVYRRMSADFAEEL
ncbi:MAG TPA: ABC transporter permease [Mycobacteriales bacterium]